MFCGVAKHCKCFRILLVNTSPFTKLFSYSVKYLKSQIISLKITMSQTAVKPPNALIYTGEDPSVVQCKWYENIAGNLRFCLNPNSYTIYLLTPAQVLKDPWCENAAILILSCGKVSNPIAECFYNYAAKGGMILNFCSTFNLPSLGVTSETKEKNAVSIGYKESEVSVMEGEFHFTCSEPFSPLASSKNGSAILKLENCPVVLSQVHLEVDPVMVTHEEQVFSALNQSNSDRLFILRDLLSTCFHLDCKVQDLPKLTPCLVFLKDVNSAVKEFIKKQCLSKQKIKLFDCYDDVHVCEVTQHELPVYFQFPESLHKDVFSTEDYFTNLKAKVFGNMVFFVDVIGTTMDLIADLECLQGAVVIANLQRHGKGRGDNKWISPRGCAMFSLHFSLSKSSKLGQRLSVIQQMCTLAAVMSVRKIPGYEKVDIRMKWPNDIYYGRETKIGGVLVNVTIQGDCVRVFTGCGVNIMNSKPTVCLNDIIQFHNTKTGDNLPVLKPEAFIAHCLSELEGLVDDFQLHGSGNFLSLVNLYWLHSEQEVTIEPFKEKATIVGLDDFGYLLVKTAEGKNISLHPDGNRFDLMKNLIYPK